MIAPNETLTLLLIAAAGVALFVAGREFVKGLRSAQQDTQRRDGQQKEFCEEENSERKTNHKDGARAESKLWHDVLQVGPNADREEIKRGYRRMVTLYHPDRVEGLGADLQIVAVRRAKEINEAYSFARKLRNF